MDETSMIERVARALSVADGMHPEAVSNDEDQVPIWTLYVDDARAAIEAMRVPTKEMDLAGVHAESFRSLGLLKVHHIWGDMIDAALSQAIGNKESGE